ncbi:hypothetical protein ACFY2Y_15500 [Janibacter hoylei]|uniref:hypothetical protein n=1 Tax=Janibacter hoylei TaxID=364298 RepID=UPI0036C7D976
MSDTNPTPDPAANAIPAGSELDVRVAQLEKLVTHLVKAFNTHRETTSEEIEATATALAGVQKMLAPTPDAPAIEGPGVAPWTERATAQQWHDLATWVDWLCHNYEFRAEVQIYSCWPAHPGIVEELAALWDAWRDAAGRAAVDGAPPGDNDALAFWHDRYLAPCVHRLHAIYSFKECRHQHESAAPAPQTDRDLLPPPPLP